MKVTINQSLNCWVLCISRNEQVLKVYTRKTLVALIDVACVLQLHVDNISELPLTQYLGG